MYQDNTKKQKRKLNFSEMIDHIEGKGITFNEYRKEDAIDFLKNNNYYFKLTSYRKNFMKASNGEYIGLDFAGLVDLASIDMRLRYLVFRMCLDLEHIVKTVILSDITMDPNEDGYEIVDDFRRHLKDKRPDRNVSDVIKHISSSNSELHMKHKDRLSVWVLLEMIQFGDFKEFVEFYFLRKNRPARFKDANNLLICVLNLRNSAAHNNCLINNITKKNEINSPKQDVSIFLNQIPGLSKTQVKDRPTNKRIHDICAMIYLYDNYVKGEKMKKARYGEMRELLDRCLKNKHLHKRNPSLKNIYLLFDNIVAHLEHK